MNKKYGHWESNGIEFTNKYKALVYASQNNTKVEFKYYTSIWKNFDRSLLGKVPLSVLYKERAQQLRDRYQYIVLYYSGGADSHNILRTFIDNNIKLDEVCVKWPKVLQSDAIFTPNTIDKSPRNYWSEWEFAIKPILQWLAANKPDIKITIKDYVSDVNNISLLPAFDKLDHMRSGGMLFCSALTDSMNEKKSIGHIYGIDKPLLVVDDQNNVGTFFSDFSLGTISTDGDDNGEGFYWAPDFPLLTLEMAYQTVQYYKINKEDRKYLKWATAPLWDLDWSACVLQKQSDIAKATCYTTWDYRFQSDKPVSRDRADKFFWFHEYPEFNNALQEYKHHVTERLSGLDKRFITSSKTQVNLTTEIFYIDKIQP